MASADTSRIPSQYQSPAEADKLSQRERNLQSQIAWRLRHPHTYKIRRRIYRMVCRIERKLCNEHSPENPQALHEALLGSFRRLLDITTPATGCPGILLEQPRSYRVRTFVDPENCYSPVLQEPWIVVLGKTRSIMMGTHVCRVVLHDGSNRHRMDKLWVEDLAMWALSEGWDRSGSVFMACMPEVAGALNKPGFVYCQFPSRDFGRWVVVPKLRSARLDRAQESPLVPSSGLEKLQFLRFRGVEATTRSEPEPLFGWR